MIIQPSSQNKQPFYALTPSSYLPLSIAFQIQINHTWSEPSPSAKRHNILIIFRCNIWRVQSKLTKNARHRQTQAKLCVRSSFEFHKLAESLSNSLKSDSWSGVPDGKWYKPLTRGHRDNITPTLQMHLPHAKNTRIYSTYSRIAKPRLEASFSPWGTPTDPEKPYENSAAARNYLHNGI